MKHILLCLLAVLSVTLLYGQKQGNIWYFQGNGIDFNSGAPVLLTNGQIPSGNGIEGTASIADSAGNILFYATAQQIWNRNHQPMAYGHGLLGGLSSTQGVFIVPLPNSDSLFYVFTLDEMQNCFQNGLRYSIVDMCLYNGLGSVVMPHKNIPLLDSAGEKMAATFHANGNDIWLVVHPYFSDAFYAYLITEHGIVDTVISHVGSYHPADSSADCYQAIGQMKISPDGSKLALVNANAFTHSIRELFDFNTTSGVVSNVMDLEPDSVFQYYGVAFSPDNSKLYLTKLTPPYQVLQYDLSSGIPANIVASKTILQSTNSSSFGGLQLGPDGKIYIVAQGTNYISIIPDPNNPGVSCGYIVQGLTNVNPMQWSLPNFIDSYAYKHGVTGCMTVGIHDRNGITASIYPHPFSDQTTIVTDRDLEGALLTVYNSSGEALMQMHHLSGRTIHFHRGNLPDGLYFLCITQEGSVIWGGKIAISVQ
jgi:hypothetical protein